MGSSKAGSLRDQSISSIFFPKVTIEMLQYVPVLVLVSLAGVSLGGADEAVAALVLTEENFISKVSASPTFVMFFAPWCGHCKRLSPTWEELARKMNTKAEKKVTIGKVDCTEQTGLCSAQDITGYPTLKFFKDGVKYQGNRDLSSLEEFINESLGIEVAEEKPAFTETENAIVESSLHILSEGSFKETISSGDTFIKFYAPWCGHCQKLAPVWDELAKKFEADSKVKIAKLDCTQAKSVCHENDVQSYPTLTYFRNGRMLEEYKGCPGARNIDDLTDFVKFNKDQPDTAATDKVQEGYTSPVVKLDKDNFEEKTKTGLAFVKFFAPWCGHCKRLAPTWEKLAEEFETKNGVVIGHMDCTAGDNNGLCNFNGVDGFPTLNIYKKGVKIEEYNGSRGLSQLQEFVAFHLTEQSGEKEAGFDQPDTAANLQEELVSPVVMLNKENFEGKTKTGVVFIKFFALLCKRLDPTWEQLAQNFKSVDGVMIAQVNCTPGDGENANNELCDSNSVDGFPTLIIYNEGVKVEEFNGKRDIFQLQKFVKKHLTENSGQKEVKDEL